MADEWPVTDGEWDEFMDQVRAVYAHILSEHGARAAFVAVRLILAWMDDEITEEEVKTLGRDIYRRGEWRPAARRLTELGVPLVP